MGDRRLQIPKKLTVAAQADNPSRRKWWGGGSIRARDLGTWGGKRIKQPIGAREGRYDKKFVSWCDEHGLLCVRTVDLFWLFENYRSGFYGNLSVAKLRKRWKEDKSLSRSTEVYVPTGRHAATGYPQLRLANPAELKQYRKERDPGPWKSYLRQRRAYFAEQSGRYNRALKFWRECGQQARQSFHRCARYSNRQADSHPDYLVAPRDKQGRVLQFGFVEVKGPRESLRPSQRRFFPELVRRAGKNVWLARVPDHGTVINFWQFTATGEVRPCDSTFERP
jgi:hypothetical protein